MKRTAAGLPALLLIAPGAALAGSGDATIYRGSEDGYFFQPCAAYADGTVYVFVDREVYGIWDGARLELRAWREGAFSRPEGTYAFLEVIVSDGSKLWAVVVDQSRDAAMNFTFKAYLYEVVIGGDGTADLGAGVELDWSPMIECDGESVDRRPLRSSCMAGDKLAFISLDGEGSAFLMTYDARTGEGQSFPVDDLYELCAYGDGRALAFAYDYDRYEGDAQIWALDLNDGSRELMYSYPLESLSPMMAPAHDPATDTLYYVMGDELRAVPGMDFGREEAVGSVRT